MNLRKLAQGQECQIRIPGVCNFDSTTTVLAHYRMSGDGMGRKPPDEHGAFACSACHDMVDNRTLTAVVMNRTEVKLYHAEGVFRTQDLCRLSD